MSLFQFYFPCVRTLLQSTYILHYNTSVVCILCCVQLHVALETIQPPAVFWKSFVKSFAPNTWHPPTFGSYLFSLMFSEQWMQGGKHNEIYGRGRGRVVLIWPYRNWQTAIKLSLSSITKSQSAALNQSSIESNCPHISSFSFWNHLSHLTFSLSALNHSDCDPSDSLLYSWLLLCCQGSTWKLILDVSSDPCGWNFERIEPTNSWAANQNLLQNMQWRRIICVSYLMISWSDTLRITCHALDCWCTLIRAVSLMH